MKKDCFKKIINAIHIFIILSIIFVIFRAVICVDTGHFDGSFFESLKKSILVASLTEWLTFIGAVAFVLFGVNGIYEFCYTNGIDFLVPPIYQKSKNDIMLKQAEQMMRLYFDKDIDFIKTYEKERTNHIFDLLRLNDKQFHHIRYEILKARAESISDIRSLKKVAKSLLLNKEYIIDLSKFDSVERVYSDVQYYLDLYTALFDDDVYEDAGRLMANFLRLKCDKELENIDCIVIPYGSNLLLGLSTAKKLGIRMVSILKESRKLNNQSWDGDYPEKTDGEKVKIAILHDVLVSGNRICKSLEKLPPDSFEIVGLFSLVYHKTQKGFFDALNKCGIENNKIHNILEVTDKEMEKIVNGKK